MLKVFSWYHNGRRDIYFTSKEALEAFRELINGRPAHEFDERPGPDHGAIDQPCTYTYDVYEAGEMPKIAGWTLTGHVRMGYQPPLRAGRYLSSAVWTTQWGPRHPEGCNGLWPTKEAALKFLAENCPVKLPDAVLAKLQYCHFVEVPGRQRANWQNAAKDAVDYCLQLIAILQDDLDRDLARQGQEVVDAPMAVMEADGDF